MFSLERNRVPASQSRSYDAAQAVFTYENIISFIYNTYIIAN